MIASFETMLLGTMTKLPDFVRSFVARQVTSATRPSKSPTRIQWPTWNGFSLWIASPANAFPSVSCSAKPMHHRADRGRRQQLVVEHERRHQHQEPDDDEVLKDRRIAIGNAILAKRIEEGDDERG